MCAGTTLPAWQARCLEALMDEPGVDLALVVVGERSRPRTARLARARTWLWDLYHRRYVARRARSLRPVDLSSRLEDVPRVECGAERIREHDLDVLLDLSGTAEGSILDAARFGVWSFDHDVEERRHGGDPVTGAALQRLAGRPDGRAVLHEGWFATTPHSYVRTVDEVRFGSADWPLRACRELLAGSAAGPHATPVRRAAQVQRKSGNLQTARFLARQGLSFVAHQVRSIVTADRWNVAVADVQIERFLDGEAPPLRWLPPLRSRSEYLADPFGVADADGVTLLAEHYDYAAHRGAIVALETDGAGGRPAPVLALGGHASYPFLVTEGDEVYCIPETARAGEVRVFRAVDFPTQWEDLGAVVTGVAALDPTVVHHEGRWWMFFADRDTGPTTKLHLWWADDLLGPWQPHATNPVKTDVRSARPAGTPFVAGGTLYRPAQDCSVTYGGAVAVNRVEVLTPTEFREEVVAVVRPDPEGPFPHGLHTLSAAGPFTLVDGKRRTFSWPSTRTEIRARWRRLRSRREPGGAT